VKEEDKASGIGNLRSVNMYTGTNEEELLKY
jgi:hypothetical protein